MTDAGCIKGPSADGPTGSYTAPTDEERTELDRMMPDFFAALGDSRESLERFERVFRGMGLTLSEFGVGTERMVVLLETGPKLRGAAGYVFRRGPVEHEMILQAPPSFHEPHSLLIMRRIVGPRSMRGLFFSTIHRYLTPQQVCGQAYPADVAHGRWVAEFERGHFVHVELSDSFATRSRTDDAVASSVAAALVSGD